MDVKSKKVIDKNVRWVLGGYLLILILVAFTFKTAIDSLDDANNTLRIVVETNNEKSQHIIKMRDTVRDRIVAMYGITQLDDAFEIDEQVQIFSLLAHGFIEARENLKKMDLSVTLINQLEEQRKKLSAAQPVLDAVVEKIINEEENPNLEEDLKFAFGLNKQVIDGLETMHLLQYDLAKKAVVDSSNHMREVKQQLFILIIIVAFIASIVLWIVLRVINKQNKEVESLVEQLNKTNLGLEDAVTKRTNELLVTKEDNARMGAELAITHKIQQMLLPLASELDTVPNLEIAASMKPAEEAGGDYYDVLRYDNKTIIAIGDVTGHGLESSVVMLMTQAAVRTLAVSNITNPVEFLDVLNQTIYDNLRRLDSYKNLTLMMAYYSDNEFVICGQHEDVLILRKDSDTVEQIDTVDYGFPIGLERDIKAFIQPHTIPFNSGDIIVLYTDGIPEAENEKGAFYGLDKLCQQLVENRNQSPQDIHDVMNQKLYAFIGNQEVFDDVTLMVIKHS